MSHHRRRDHSIRRLKLALVTRNITVIEHATRQLFSIAEERRMKLKRGSDILNQAREVLRKAKGVEEENALARRQAAALYGLSKKDGRDPDPSGSGWRPVSMSR